MLWKAKICKAQSEYRKIEKNMRLSVINCLYNAIYFLIPFNIIYELYFLFWLEMEFLFKTTRFEYLFPTGVTELSRQAVNVQS